MSRTADEIRSEIDALRRAKATGTLSVSYGDHSATYRSIYEMNSVLKDLEAELAGLNGTARVRSVAFLTGKGL